MNQKLETFMVIVASLLVFSAGCQTPHSLNQSKTAPISLNSLRSYEVPLTPTAQNLKSSSKVNANGSLPRDGLIFRGQDGPNGYPKQPVQVSQSTSSRVTFQENAAPGNAGQAPAVEGPGNQVPQQVPQGGTFGDYPNNPIPYAPNGFPPGQGQMGLGQPFITPPGIQNGNVADLDIFVREGQTGQFMIGAGINSDAGLTGQLTISERNFDILRFPRSFADIGSGEAFRGRGQSFRLEALPGTRVQRYLVSFGEPYFYLFGQPFSFNTSGYYFTRGYFDWDEQRLGGSASLGYRLTQDVSINLSARAEDITIFNPRLATSPELNEVLGDSSLYSLSVGLTHDTRDHPFLSSQGHLFSLSYRQAFGDFDYARGDLEYRKYWLLTQRPDGSGKQTISHSTKAGITGSQTPVFENYFAGGFSTMRGFDFRGASPTQGGVIVGGEFQFLNSLEYTFPITADDMFKGVLFCDYGTVESSVTIDEDNFRVVPGFGFRVNLPIGGAGGAPLAFDFGFPVASAATDDRRMFSFYMAVMR
ncbi:MAG: BamA/TamA family outer membrane protein [Planctomycetota bacterium]|nr:BamA/TamA family outer membrane protein [Planctomycetota bacterium]